VATGFTSVWTKVGLVPGALRCFNELFWRWRCVNWIRHNHFITVLDCAYRHPRHCGISTQCCHVLLACLWRLYQLVYTWTQQCVLSSFQRWSLWLCCHSFHTRNFGSSSTCFLCWTLLQLSLVTVCEWSLLLMLMLISVVLVVAVACSGSCRIGPSLQYFDTVGWVFWPVKLSPR